MGHWQLLGSSAVGTTRSSFVSLYLGVSARQALWSTLCPTRLAMSCCPVSTGCKGLEGPHVGWARGADVGRLWSIILTTRSHVLSKKETMNLTMGHTGHEVDCSQELDTVHLQTDM